MSTWTIQPLVYGTIDLPKSALTPGFDVGMVVKLPYLGFLLSDGRQRVLVDTGVHQSFFSGGRGYQGAVTEGGDTFVVDALAKVGVTPDDIDLVIYTHLHSDHCGNAHLFTRATHLFQESEWAAYLDPLPIITVRREYHPERIGMFASLKCERVAGDVPLLDGIELLHTPGHTPGSQSLLVRTRQGTYCLAGDLAHILHVAYPQSDRMTQLDGSVVAITPAPPEYGPGIPTPLVYDYYAWYRSLRRVKAIIRDPAFLLTGHDPVVVGKTFG